MIEIVMRDKNYIRNLDKTIKSKIKKDLTLVNPKYASAVKFSRNGYTSVPKYLTFYEEDDINNSLTAPIGLDISQYTDDYNIRDYRVKKEAEYPEFKLELREDQREAAKSYFNLNREGSAPNGVISLPTGKGKTILALYIARSVKQKTLVIIHKNDLLLGWQKDIDECFGEIEVGVIKAQRNKVGEQITIATVQTLARKTNAEREALYDSFGLVIVDECHHTPSSTYSVFGKFNSMYKMALSATPERGDGLTPITHFYAGGFAYKYRYQKRDGDILPVEVNKKVLRHVYFEPVVLPNGDIVNKRSVKDSKYIGYFEAQKKFKIAPLLKFPTVENDVIPQMIPYILGDTLKEMSKNRSVLVFFNFKEHCRLFYNRLANLVGDNKVQLYYGDSKESDEILLKRAEDKEVLVTITTYSKAKEGTNCKAWEVAFLAGNINDAKNVEQAIGRIRRKGKNKISPVLVYDYSLPNVYPFSRYVLNRTDRYKQIKCYLKKA